MVSSGPYRFLAKEFVPGSSGAYEKFQGYIPRNEKPSWASGGKHAYIERIEWKIINDASTASAALQTGEVDWWEQVQPDLLPLLRKNPDLTVTNFNAVGFFGTMRFNHLHPPFNNAAIRRAVRIGMNQDDYMSAVTGNDPSIYRTCKALFPCGTPYGEELGTMQMTGDVGAARTALKAAGYAGEKVVILNPADIPTIGPFGHVTFDYLKALGMNAEMQDMDWNTLAQWRTKTDPPDKGGWSIFHNWWLGSSIVNPAISALVRGLGATGWAGSFTHEKYRGPDGGMDHGEERCRPAAPCSSYATGGDRFGTGGDPRAVLHPVGASEGTARVAAGHRAVSVEPVLGVRNAKRVPLLR